MPVASLAPSDDNNEQIVFYRLSQLKLHLTLEEKRYSLIGSILFEPLRTEAILGHYVAAVKCDECFMVFDDLRKTCYRMDEEIDVVIHCLFYIRENSVHEPNSDESSFNYTPTQHTDDSFYRLYHNRDTENFNLRL